MISPKLVQLAKILEIRARRQTEHQLTGSFHSAFKGEGLDFKDVREYYLGDDTGRIDWNVSARTGKPYVRTYFEDKNIHLIIALDISHSMRFGSDQLTKSEIAFEMVSLLLLIANLQKHKSHLILFSGDINLYSQVKPGEGEILKALTKSLEIERENEDGSSDYQNLIYFIQKVMRKRAVMFILSDFLGVQRPISFMQLRKKFKLNLIQISDQLEENMITTHGMGHIPLVDLETKESLMLANSDYPRIDSQMKKHYPLEHFKISGEGYTIQRFIDYLNRKQ